MIKKTEKIAGFNQKGGVGKTTSMRNMGQALSMEGKRTLLIDFDSQKNLTLCCGFKPEETNFVVSIADLMAKSIKDEDLGNMVKESIIKINDNLDLIPGDVALAQIEMLLPSAMNRNNGLSNIVNLVEDEYDYILIDCGPSLGLLTINALVVATKTMIMTEPSYLSMEGVDLLIDTMLRIKKRINKDLEIEGILITRVDMRLNSAKSNIKKIHENYGKHIRVFKTYIPERAKIKDAKENHTSVIEYAPGSDAAVAYVNVVEEMLNDR